MTAQFRTATGSVYEVDRPSMAIRRLNGIADPTPRQGEDGQWKVFESIGRPVIGASLIVVWQTVINDEGQPVAQSTITSPVVEVFGWATDVDNMDEPC